MIIRDNKARLFRSVAGITRAQELVEVLSKQNVRAYYVKKEG